MKIDHELLRPIGDDEIFDCPTCGQSTSLLTARPPIVPVRPWRLANSSDVLRYVDTLAQETHEWLLVLFVDGYLNLLSVETLGKGNISDVEVDFGRIWKRGLVVGAAGFFLVHNHPSGNPEPSIADTRLTARLRELSDTMDMVLIEHFIVAAGGWSSILWNEQGTGS